MRAQQVLFTAGLADALIEEMAFWVKEHASPVPPMWTTVNGAELAADGGSAPAGQAAV